MNWQEVARGPTACVQPIAKEFQHAVQITCHRGDCRRHVAAGGLAAPIAAQAQGVVTTGVARGPVIVDDADGIAVDQRPAFREYIIRERVPNYTIPDRVIVGGVLPETGVTYYDVPQSFGVTPYRYTVVNGRTVLVEPRSRRIVQVVE